ncbi:anthranilate synthase component 1 [Shewanella sp. AS1]|uniref:anthranilate synthase component 1 n=1 Tax=Shewanella sp. AS1 TaxID=2907626 RepID=UPI001F1A7DBF|nr:anthranilate synthase component 1 [Shewanella sp. AS1]MCE9678662.1 anthranilate synthase component 1 [Shewanella sp. AS1]
MAHDTLASVSTHKERITYHDDPLNLYQQLTHDAPNTLLLESAEIDSKDHLKSIVMTHAAMMIRCEGYTLTFKALTPNGQTLLSPIHHYFSQDDARLGAAQLEDDGLILQLRKPSGQLDEDAKLKATSPLDGLRTLLQQIETVDKPEFESLFLGGVLAYDLIDTIEPLPTVSDSDNTCPDYLFYLAETLILVDHQDQRADIITHDFSGLNTFSAHFSERRDKLKQACETLSPIEPLCSVEADVQVNISDDDFKTVVNNLKEHINAGDIFQVVPSRSFSLPCPNTLGAYRALRLTNPSPYMFYFRGEDFTLFGASPESAIKYEAATNQVEIYPIAGTRKRGKLANGEIDFDLDSRIELELRLDKKELSEHLMLVDLARNDVARISQSGSRKVPELLKVDRYSHVMHLVSRVTGQLRTDLDALHAYQACMNMGTLTGAPKVRAAQLIRKAEKTRRGSYGGAVGYLNALGDMDTCIVIRSAFVKNAVAHIQAGAGLVYDSDPQAEADETRQKAQAVISAIKMGGGR